MKHGGGGSVILWGCIAAGGSGAVKKVNEIMKKEDYLQILLENLKSSAEDWVLGAVGYNKNIIPNTHQK